MDLLNGLKNVASVLKEANKIEQYKQILDMMEQALNLQSQVQNLSSEKKDLLAQLKLSQQLLFKNNAYWIANSDEGPFCSGCWDNNKKTVRLHSRERSSYWDCMVCEKVTKIGYDQSADIIPQREESNFDLY